MNTQSEEEFAEGNPQNYFLELKNPIKRKLFDIEALEKQ